MDRSRWGIFLPKGETQRSRREEKEKERDTRRASKKENGDVSGHGTDGRKMDMVAHDVST